MEMSLPSLSTKTTPRYPLVPRRYEETRPVVVQDFTHRRILGFGHEIHRQQREQIELEKLAAIRQAEEAVWQQAEKVKDESVESVKKQSKLDQERIVRKMLKEMDKKLKQEGLRVEMAMQKLALEQVKEERMKCENALNEAVKQCENKAESEKMKAIGAVQTQERTLAQAAVTRLSKQHDAEVAKVRSELSAKHKQEMDALAKQKDTERVKAVEEACQKEQQKAASNLRNVQKNYEKEIKDLNLQIASKVQEILALQEEIKQFERSKHKVEECLLDTRREFQRAITQIGGFNEDQASCLMPPLYLEEIQKS